jgi:hypothetical protein
MQFNNYKTVAISTKTGYDSESGKLYLTFEITDQETKNKIIKDWNVDLEFN